MLDSGPSTSQDVRPASEHEDVCTVLDPGPSTSRGVPASSEHGAVLDPGPSTSRGVPASSEHGAVLDPGPSTSRGVPASSEHGAVLDPGPSTSRGVPASSEHGAVLDPGPSTSRGVPASSEHGAVLDPGPSTSRGVPASSEHGAVLDPGPSTSQGVPASSEHGAVLDPGPSTSQDIPLPSENEDIDATEVIPAYVTHRLWLSVELAVFLATLGMSLSSSVVTQLLLVRNCQTMFSNNTTICDLLIHEIESSDARRLEAIVEPHVTILLMYKAVIEACIPAVMSMFLGPWSDYHGRKPLLLWPLLGYGLMYVSYAFLSQVPDLRPNYFLLASIPVALSGGLITIISGIYAYTSDTSSIERRVLRMGLLDGSLFGGFMVGTYLSASLFSAVGKYGYITIFATSAVCSLLAFLYTTCIPESVNVKPEDELNGGLCSVFDSQLVVTMVTTCCKKRQKYGRAVIFLTIIVIASFVVTIEGESNVSFVYTRAKFGWDLSKYTHFSSLATLVAVLGAILGMFIISVWLKVPDSVFAVTVFITKALQTFTYALAPKEWYMYVGCAVGFLGGVSGPLCRTIMSKTVPMEDIGTVFALASVVEALIPIASSPLYTFVYNATLLTFPGAFYVMSAILFVMDAVLMSIVILLQHISQGRNYTRLEDIDE